MAPERPQRPPVRMRLQHPACCLGFDCGNHDDEYSQLQNEDERAPSWPEQSGTRPVELGSSLLNCSTQGTARCSSLLAMKSERDAQQQGSVAVADRVLVLVQLASILALSGAGIRTSWCSSLGEMGRRGRRS